MARIGLVLGAGGAVGEGFHAGVLRAISEVTGFDPRSAEIVVGTSAGSVVAASLRAGLGAADIFARATGRPLTASGERLFDRLPSAEGALGRTSGERRLGPSSPELLGRFLTRPQSFKAAKAITALLPEGRRDVAHWFANFDLAFPAGSWPAQPLWICAVSLEEGRRVVFGQDEPPDERPAVARAVQASCAIPAIFKPVVIQGRRYVDGGIHSPTNADLLAGMALDAVIVSSPMSMSGPVAKGRGGRLAGVTRYPAGRALRRELALLATQDVPVLTFEPNGELVSLMGLQAMDFSRRAPVAEQTLAMVRRSLEDAAGEVGRVLAGG